MTWYRRHNFFNKKSVMKLKDIFIGDFDYKAAIAEFINDPDILKDAIS